MDWLCAIAVIDEKTRSMQHDNRRYFLKLQRYALCALCVANSDTFPHSCWTMQRTFFSSSVNSGSRMESESPAQGDLCTKVAVFMSDSRRIAIETLENLQSPKKFPEYIFFQLATELQTHAWPLQTDKGFTSCFHLTAAIWRPLPVQACRGFRRM